MPLSHRPFPLLHLAALTLGLYACGSQTNLTSSTKERWDTDNNPLNLARDYQRDFQALPLTGQLPTLPWADSYWPSQDGGIAYRWNVKRKGPFAPRLHTFNELAALPLAKMARLSPAEKYDIFAGAYDYPLVVRERERTHRSLWLGLGGHAEAFLESGRSKSQSLRREK